jgi:hypothetical protein
MPKLINEFSKIFKALVVLLRVYRRHPDFENELQQVHALYRFIVIGFVVQFLEGGFGLRSHRDAVRLTDSEYDATLSGLKAIIAEETKHLPNVGQNGQAQVQACPDALFAALNDLAYRWKLRVSQAAIWLFFELVADEVKYAGLEFQTGPSFHPYYSTEKRHPIHINVPDWLLVEEGQKPIVKQFERVLAKRLARLKADGLSEYPHSIEKHAQWWFDHYVLGKKYKELARDSQSMNVANREESIRRAVSNFSKLLRIRTKT